MLLHDITTDRSKYQFRERAYSPQTVDAIVNEGLDPSKFDPIPIIRQDDGRIIVAGDGHSRLEACQRLADDGRLPEAWQRDDGWEIPTREVTHEAARKLAWSANLSRDDFTPIEEARIYRARVDADESIEEIARSSHRTVHHVRRSIKVLDLCRDIQEAVGKCHGINMMTAQILAVEFERYGIDKNQQRDLWHKALKHAALTAELAKRFMRTIGRRIQKAKVSNDALFDLTASAAQILEGARAELEAIQKARIGIQKLIDANGQGVLDEFPELSQWIGDHSEHALKSLNKRFRADAESLGRSRRSV